MLANGRSWWCRGVLHGLHRSWVAMGLDYSCSHAGAFQAVGCLFGVVTVVE